MKGQKFFKAINTWNLELFKSFRNMKSKFFSENKWSHGKHCGQNFKSFQNVQREDLAQKNNGNKLLNASFGFIYFRKKIWISYSESSWKVLNFMCWLLSKIPDPSKVTSKNVKIIRARIHDTSIKQIHRSVFTCK